MTLTVTNPPGTQRAGAFAVLAVAFAAAPGYPCGVITAGYGMLPGWPGEVLVDLAQVGLTMIGGTRNDPPEPVEFALSLPPLPTLYGLPLFAQGAMIDVRIGVTTAVQLVIGS